MKPIRLLTLCCLTALPSLAADKILILGDSLSKEYEITFRGIPGIVGICPDNQDAWEARNWAEILQRLRGESFNMGSVDWYADFRVYGHRYNWAFAGAKASDIQSRLYSDGAADRYWQDTLFDAVKDDADRVVIFCGGNDINAAYGEIYKGTRTGTSVINPIFLDINSIISKVRSENATVPIVLVAVPHPGTSPSVQKDHPFDNVKTARVTNALVRLNNRLRALARQRDIGFADVFTPTRPLLRGQGIYIGGIPFYNKADDNARPRFLFACDGFHPNTPLQAGIAAIIVDAFLEKYPQTGLTPMTEREILQRVIRVNPDLAFKLWAKAAGLTGVQAVMHGDKDRDGLNHLEEMAFNLNPNVEDTHLLPTPTTQIIDGTSYAVISWRPLQRYTGYLSITPQISTNGTPWKDAPEGSITVSANGNYTLRAPETNGQVRFSFLVDLIGINLPGMNQVSPESAQLSREVAAQ